MVHPVLVHHPEHDHPLQLPHGGFPRLHPVRHGLVDHPLPLGVVGPGRVQQLLGQLGGGGVLRLGLKLPHLLFGEQAQQVGGGGPEFLAAQVPVRLGGHRPRHRGGQHILHRAVDVLPVQHLPPLLVDDLPLGVHHIVVLQHGFPGLEVPGLHLLLGVLNGVGQHFLVQGGVLVHA